MKRIYSSHWSDYELIDAGNDKKLERWGEIITIRPDRNAYFSPILSSKEWKQKAHFEFIEETSSKGVWKDLRSRPTTQSGQATSFEWQISYKNCIFNLRLTQFKHLGIFPEQQTNWDFIKSNIKPEEKYLNLFAYTG